MTTSYNDDLYLAQLLEQQSKLERTNLLAYVFPEETNETFYSGALYSRKLYPKHLEFFNKGRDFRQRLFTAANQVGKSFAGCVEVAYHATGLYPDWWEGKRFNHPVKIWVASFTLKIMIGSVIKHLLGSVAEPGTGLLPKSLFTQPGQIRSAPGVPGAIELVMIPHATGGMSSIEFKSYESGQQGFVGAQVHVVLFDEEPPLVIYTEGLMRTITTKGIVMVTFTPDRGFSDTVLEFFDHGSFRTGQVGDKWVTNCAWDDVPHLTDDAKRELWKSIPPYLRDAKTKGIPYLGAGAIYPVLKEDITIKPFQIPKEWPKAFGMDAGWTHPTAVVWGAYQEQTDTWYIYAEYRRAQEQVAVHAATIKGQGEWIPGIIDKAANQTRAEIGISLIELYARHGVKLDLASTSTNVDTGIAVVLDRMSTGRLKIFSTCQQVFEELAIYRRDAHGKPIKEKDDLLDALRYLIEGGEYIMRTTPALNKPDEFNYLASGSGTKSRIGGY